MAASARSWPRQRMPRDDSTHPATSVRSAFVAASKPARIVALRVSGTGTLRVKVRVRGDGGVLLPHEAGHHRHLHHRAVALHDRAEVHEVGDKRDVARHAQRAAAHVAEGVRPQEGLHERGLEHHRRGGGPARIGEIGDLHGRGADEHAVGVDGAGGGGDLHDEVDALLRPRDGEVRGRPDLEGVERRGRAVERADRGAARQEGRGGEGEEGAEHGRPHLL